MSQVVIIGCGVVGAAIAYELSRITSLKLTVLDRQPPAQGSTGAALGVLIGAMSQKKQGRAWALREYSLRTYEEWVSELEQATGHSIRFNRDGLVRLMFGDEDWQKWETLRIMRHQQGWPLDLWSRAKLDERYPGIGGRMGDRVITGAIYSGGDRQIDPKALTHALVAASRQRGVTFHFDAEVCGFDFHSDVASLPRPRLVHTASDAFQADWVIIAAGLGTVGLTQVMQQPVDIRPVLGQAMRVRVPVSNARAMSTFRPVLTGDDIHLISLLPQNDYAARKWDYWIGATVEFPDDAGAVTTDPALFQSMWARAIAMYPALADAKILEQWSGKRPRPFGRPAPIVEPMTGHSHVILATGHYRNGVLLAPATARLVKELMGFLSER